MRQFIDTNILLYAFSRDPRGKAALLLMENDFEISVQVLNEVANVSRRKMRKTWDEINQILDFIRMAVLDIHPMTSATHVHGMSIARRYQLPIYDSMLLAAALIAGCDTFHSEDLRSGLVIEDQLTIRNPFAGD